MSVDVLTTAPWMFSVGDIATLQETQRQLAHRNIASVAVDEPRPGRTTVVGGGHILGHMPHLSHFCVPGQHLLSAVGAHSTEAADWSFLREYRYRSVRDATSAEIIGGNCSLVPCPAVLIEPTTRQIRAAGHRSGGHVVLHNDPIVARAIESRIVTATILDPQPGRKCVWRLGGDVLPTMHDPGLMVAAIVGAHAVVTRSLHLSIFALAAGVPFCCIDTGDEPQSNKMRDYWMRAGAPEVMYDGDDPIRHAVSFTDWKSLRDRERAAARSHMDAMSEVITATEYQGPALA
jgi:hypothetical protein